MITFTHVVAFIVALLTSVIVTPLIIKLAYFIGATDKPSNRKIHHKIMPRLGGLAIVSGVISGYFILKPQSPYLVPIAISAGIIIAIGVLDDKYSLTPRAKIIGQIVAASIVVMSGLKIDLINLPFSGQIYFGIWSYPFTVLWIVGVTNAINLIDGLDGLAAGVSSIALATILTMAILDGQAFVIALVVILLGSTLGFLAHNFYPAKIFMGDTGSLFLGYSISIISILGLFKNVTLISFIIPVIILAIPIFDTLFAIIRRVLKKQKISTPDKSHLHNCLLEMGFSHRKTVLIIYSVSAFFGASAILFSASTLWLSIFILIFLLIAIQIVAELIGIIGSETKPLLNLIKKFGYGVRGEPKLKR